MFRRWCIIGKLNSTRIDGVHDVNSRDYRWNVKDKFCGRIYVCERKKKYHFEQNNLKQDILKCNHYIQFKLPVQFGAKLLPISLPEKEDEKLNDGTMCFVTGWRNTLVSWDVCDKVKYLSQQKVNYSKISNFFELYIITQYDVW